MDATEMNKPPTIQPPLVEPVAVTTVGEMGVPACAGLGATIIVCIAISKAKSSANL